MKYLEHIELIKKYFGVLPHKRLDSLKSRTMFWLFFVSFYVLEYYLESKSHGTHLHLFSFQSLRLRALCDSPSTRKRRAHPMSFFFELNMSIYFDHISSRKVVSGDWLPSAFVCPIAFLTYGAQNHTQRNWEECYCQPPRWCQMRLLICSNTFLVPSHTE